MTALLVSRAIGLATVQDGGRPGHMHEAVPPGGAMVPELLARANRAAGNTPGAAAIETFGSISVVARGRIEVASDDGLVALESGETFTTACTTTRVLYLALRGGVDAPVALGGRGTLLTAKLGGHEGRGLRVGDVLRAGGEPRRDSTPDALDLDAPVILWPGPDLGRVAPQTFERLVASRPTIDPRSDRVGLRLAGVELGPSPAPDPAVVSAPMTHGAIQLPPDGVPIVLGPDHPTTGGYPVIAVVASGHRGRLFARPVGAPVRFVAAL